MSDERASAAALAASCAEGLATLAVSLADPKIAGGARVIAATVNALASGIAAGMVPIVGDGERLDAALRAERRVADERHSRQVAAEALKAAGFKP